MRAFVALGLVALAALPSAARGGDPDWEPASLAGVPARAPLDGATMPTKLGLLYIMGETESQGMIEIARTGMVPIVKSGEWSSDRIMWCKRANPHTIGIVSAGGPVHPEQDAPPAAADKIVARAKDQWSHVPEEYQPHMDFLELMPCMWEPKSATVARWYSAVITRVAPRIAELGVRPIVLNTGVGGLPLEPEVLDLMVPGLRAALHTGGAWGCHGYTIKYTTDTSHELWYSLRYRQAYDYFRQRHPDLLRLPMIMLEGGVDDRGDPDKDGWLARGTQEQYQDWLAWYDEELKKDPYVLGVTLFKIGAPSIWKSFELEPIIPWLEQHYRRAYGRAAPPREAKTRSK